MIHYHGLPMTPTADMLKAMAGRHAMVSFEEPRQIEQACEVCQSVVLDNGAFSAWKAKRAHDFDGYAAWAEKWIKHPAVDWAIIPDVIDGSEDDNDYLLKQWKHVKVLRAFGVPVYHFHESIERLHALVRNYPRIALGSSGEYATVGTMRWWNRMNEIMKAVCDKQGMPEVKLHGLRMLDPVIFAHLPLSSADSCNVARNIGIDQAWSGPYVPKSTWARALIMMDRIEHHASSRDWSHKSSGVQQNMNLIG